MDSIGGCFEKAEEVHLGLGQRHQLQGNLGKYPKRPLASHHEAYHVVAGHVLNAFAAHANDLPRGRDHLQAYHVAPGHAVLDGLAAAGVFRDVAADVAGLEAHGVAGVEEAVALVHVCYILCNHARLEGDSHIFRVDLDDAVETVGHERNTAEKRHRAA